jgi:hypothetical protein
MQLTVIIRSFLKRGINQKFSSPVMLIILFHFTLLEMIEVNLSSSDDKFGDHFAYFI